MQFEFHPVWPKLRELFARLRFKPARRSPLARAIVALALALAALAAVLLLARRR